VGGGEKIKFQKTKTEIRGKKRNWEGCGEKIKLQKILSVHHPSTLVHKWVLVHSGKP
jgi:hypothetical protein